MGLQYRNIDSSYHHMQDYTYHFLSSELPWTASWVLLQSLTLLLIVRRPILLFGRPILQNNLQSKYCYILVNEVVCITLSVDNWTP